jgi:hypothetical protein
MLLDRWGLSGVLADVLDIRYLTALNTMNSNERKNLTGQIIQETPYLIDLLNRRSRLLKLLVRDNRELWDNGEGG